MFENKDFSDCVYFNDTTGGVSVNARRALATAFGDIPLPRPSANVLGLIDELSNAVRDAALREYGMVLKDGLNNCRGQWSELLYAAFLCNLRVAGKSLPIVKLEKYNTHSVLDLLTPEHKRCADGVVAKLWRKGAKPVSTNPDFVILDDKEEFKDIYDRPIRRLDQEAIEYLLSLHNRLLGRCSVFSIRGFFTTKLSGRPDRNGQFLREAMYMQLLNSIVNAVKNAKRGRHPSTPLFHLHAATPGRFGNLGVFSETNDYRSPKRSVASATEFLTFGGLSQMIRSICGDVRSGCGRRTYRGQFREESSGKIVRIKD